MKYFIICGEASGDLHASHLITALRHRDKQARFRFFGGDLMAAAAGHRGTLLRHYSTLAYMGFVQVLLHAGTILRGMAECKRALTEWKPDCIILVDYPGFNLRMAKFAKDNAICPVVYYIPPKIWAWKTHRIHQIRRYVDCVLSILPFEEDYYREQHNYEVHYVGNPTYDEIAAHLEEQGHDITRIETCGQTGRPPADIIALLPGSRRQEICANLPVMLKAVAQFQDEHVKRPFTIFVATAPNTDETLYAHLIAKHARGVRVDLWKRNVYDLLLAARVALVTSGTATLETAILDVPQVVCYHIRGVRFVNWVRPFLLKCPYISLVNLIAAHEVVPELIAADMTPHCLQLHLQAIVDGDDRERMLQGYAAVRGRLGAVGAPQAAAGHIVRIARNSIAATK